LTFALGSLHWTPDTFWKSTFLELSCAYVGHYREKGTGFKPAIWTADDTLALEEMKRRFPDEKPN